MAPILYNTEYFNNRLSTSPPAMARFQLQDLIALAGPASAGKRASGVLIARQHGWNFVDLDVLFARRHGSIAAFIHRNGPHAYANANVEVFLADVSGRTGCVVALSTGFMKYPDTVHARYSALRHALNSKATVFVLLPPPVNDEGAASVRHLQRLRLPRPRLGASDAVAMVLQRIALRDT